MTDKPNRRTAIIIAIIGLIGTLTVAVINKWDFPGKSKVIEPNGTEKGHSTEGSSDTTSEGAISKVDPAKLADIVKEQQGQEVRKSYTETNCFTEIDLKKFKDSRRPEQVVNTLIKDNSFVNLVIAIKRMEPVGRQKLLVTCSKISKPTWAELGRITPDGQTDAGKEAELLISKAIVNKVEELIKLPEAQLQRLYQ